MLKVPLLTTGAPTVFDVQDPFRKVMLLANKQISRANLAACTALATVPGSYTAVSAMR